MAVVAVADSTGLSKAEHSDVTPDEAQPGTGGEELPMGLAFDVQDIPLVLEDTTPPTDEGLFILFKNNNVKYWSMLYAIVEQHNYTSYLLTPDKQSVSLAFKSLLLSQ